MVLRPFMINVFVNTDMRKIRKIINRSVLRTKYSEIANYLLEYKKTDWFDSNEINEYQVDKLKKLLAFSVEHVPYYRRVFQERNLTLDDFKTVSDLKKLPILTKEIVFREGENLFANVELEGIKVNTTSGSTGTPIVFRKQKSCRDIESALMRRYKENGSICDDDYGVLIWGTHSLKKQDVLKGKVKSWLLNQSVFNSYDLSDANLERLIKCLKKKEVMYLRGYTSAVFYIASLVNQRGLHFEIPFVSVTAEQLYDFQRKEIVRAFGNNLYNQYGCGECGALAFECSSHEGLHHAFEHSILEVLDDNGHDSIHGKVVLTNLDNYAMPLIRYENGDLVTVSDHECSCGRRSMLIDHIDGRTYDVFEGENGNRVHAGFLDDMLLGMDLLNTYGITQIRIVQKKPLEYVCQYVAKKEIEFTDQRELEKEYKKALGDSISLFFERRDYLKSAERGKRHFIVPIHLYEKNKSVYD